MPDWMPARRASVACRASQRGACQPRAVHRSRYFSMLRGRGSHFRQRERMRESLIDNEQRGKHVEASVRLASGPHHPGPEQIAVAAYARLSYVRRAPAERNHPRQLFQRKSCWPATGKPPAWSLTTRPARPPNAGPSESICKGGDGRTARQHYGIKRASLRDEIPAEGRLVYTSADRDGQNGNSGWNVLTGGSHVVQESAPSRTQMSTTHAWRFRRLRARVSLVIPW